MNHLFHTFFATLLSTCLLKVQLARSEDCGELAVDCLEFLECTNWGSNCSYSNFDCDAFYSCPNGDYNCNCTENDKDLRTRGTASNAYTTALTLNEIDAEGAFSNIFGTFSHILGDTLDISTTGAYSLAYSTIITYSNSISDTTWWAQSYAGAVGIEYTAYKERDIYGKGYMSLAGATIAFTIGTNEIYFESRLSGLNTVIYCNNSADCTVHCETATGCYNTSLICAASATCDVECDEDDGIICPIQYTTSDAIYYPLDIDDEYSPFWLESYSDPYNSNITSYFDQICAIECRKSFSGDCSDINDDPWNDDLFEQSNYNDGTGEALCALGYQSLWGTNAIINLTNYDVIAAGSSALNSNDNMVARNLYFLGSGTGDIDIIETKYHETGEGGIISCEGRGTCHGDVIKNADKLLCLGYNTCYDITVYGVNNIYLFGVESGQSCEVWSNDTTDGILNIYIDAVEAGFYSDVYCMAGHICTIYCFDSDEKCVAGLGGIDVECHDDATCTVKQYKPPTMAPTNTPTMPTVVPSLTPTNVPSMPTIEPSIVPSVMPSEPSVMPSNMPSEEPTIPVMNTVSSNNNNSTMMDGMETTDESVDSMEETSVKTSDLPISQGVKSIKFSFIGLFVLCVVCCGLVWM